MSSSPPPCLFEQAEHLLERLFHLRAYVRPQARLIDIRHALSQADKIPVDLVVRSLDLPMLKKHTHAGLILHQPLLAQMNALCALRTSYQF